MANQVTKYYGTAKRKRIVNLIIAVLAIIAILIVLITIYGQNVGNFVIAIETEMQVALSLSETVDFQNPTARLAARGLKEQTHATYADIPKDIMNLDGSNNDEAGKRYFAYSFYIKNTSSITLDYTADIVINKSTRGAESAVRVMVIKNDVQEVFAKSKEWPENEIGQPEDQMGTEIIENYTTIPFLSSTTVMRQNETAFVKNAINKYTVVIWLEGWDAQCTDSIKGAIIRMEMKFAGSQA